ncbi:hypothetical protein [Geosporobacter ferrireducens]|uniref:DUF5105 domain-containing protein n=1 Tax=Geosporobacter ferrireducens TaxID=1424294 RepID=A0A1D8GCP6_9FIRM|nr:hypothetical protein [Geosporobacter ferrireducens]AOT68681.1 hypothetical protein Gferi_03270 [Geosporobacter ferrireducens]MTI57565.1 hypothetical protein [Geosporobacter ferrireducens]
MNIKRISAVLLIFSLIAILGACTQNAPNKTPEDTVKNFIAAGIAEDKETFKELLKLPQDEDAFAEAYIKVYAEFAAEKEVTIDKINVRVITENDLLDGVLEQMEEEHGYVPIIAEVTNFDEQPLLFLLEKENDKYYIRNIDTRERYEELFVEQ